MIGPILLFFPAPSRGLGLLWAYSSAAMWIAGLGRWITAVGDDIY